jgi:hypothetical protein
MKAIWFSKDLYLIDTIFLKVNFLRARRQKKAKTEQSLKSLRHLKKPTRTSSLLLFYAEATTEQLNANNLVGQSSSDS